MEGCHYGENSNCGSWKMEILWPRRFRRCRSTLTSNYKVTRQSRVLFLSASRSCHLPDSLVLI